MATPPATGHQPIDLLHLGRPRVIQRQRWLRTREPLRAAEEDAAAR